MIQFRDFLGLSCALRVASQLVDEEDFGDAGCPTNLGYRYEGRAKHTVYCVLPNVSNGWTNKQYWKDAMLVDLIGRT